MNERRAIELCIKYRDPIGFEFLVRKYEREARFHAYALLRNRDDAAEACQESFASAFASLPLLTELTAFYPWFYRVLRNRCLNLLERRRNAHAYAAAETAARDAAPFAPSPDADLDRKREGARVLAVLATLSLESREILALKYLRDYDYATLAQLLGIPRGTVMSRLFHARKAFQRAWAEHAEPAAPQTGEHRYG